MLVHLLTSTLSRTSSGKRNTSCFVHHLSDLITPPCHRLAALWDEPFRPWFRVRISWTSSPLRPQRGQSPSLPRTVSTRRRRLRPLSIPLPHLHPLSRHSFCHSSYHQP